MHFKIHLTTQSRPWTPSLTGRSLRSAWLSLPALGPWGPGALGLWGSGALRLYGSVHSNCFLHFPCTESAVAAVVAGGFWPRCTVRIPKSLWEHVCDRVKVQSMVNCRSVKSSRNQKGKKETGSQRKGGSLLPAKDALGTVAAASRSRRNLHAKVDHAKMVQKYTGDQISSQEVNTDLLLLPS